MLKEVNNKININKGLFKKQIFDGIILLFAFIIIYICNKFFLLEGINYIISLILLYLIIMFLFEHSKNAVKIPLNSIIIETVQQTTQEINSIQEKNNFQKENYNVSNDKLKNTIELVQNLKIHSNNMKSLINETQEKTDKSLSFTNNEYNSVKTNIEKMFSIRHKIQTIAELILELSDFVQSISSTIGIVEDIAEQTNLLALNAAVEAARAGEHGKGFAVVASEIRKLADESKQATAKITSLINDIQQTANSTVLATEEGTKEIESGLELARAISEDIERLISSMGEISENMKKITNSSSQINQNSVTADEYITEISKIAEHNKQITSENESIFEKIETTSNNLRNSVI